MSRSRAMFLALALAAVALSVRPAGDFAESRAEQRAHRHGKGSGRQADGRRDGDCQSAGSVVHDLGLDEPERRLRVPGARCRQLSHLGAGRRLRPARR